MPGLHHGSQASMHRVLQGSSWLTMPHMQAAAPSALDQLLTRSHVAVMLMAQAAAADPDKPARKLQVVWDPAAHPFLPCISLKAA